MVHSRLILALFLMLLALIPKRRVDFVSSTLSNDGEHVTTSVVLELPPSDCCRSLVKQESLYGMCPFLPSVSLLMTLPSAESD